MRVRRNWNLVAVLLSALCALVLTGCSVHATKTADGKDKDVDIHSPFGSVSVHAGTVEAKDIGLPAYPGARPAKSDDDDNNDDNANVNISSPFFGVKVVVQKFETDDSPDKVLDFYMKPMGKFGKVIQCNGEYRGYHHHHGNEQVSCDNTGGKEKELKVGTEDNQHVVAVRPRGTGTKFTLVYVRARENDDKDTI